MKPVVFQTIGEAYALGQKFLSAGLYDNYQIANLPVVFVQGIYWEIETIKGYLALNAVLPGRDASVTLLTLDGIHPRKTEGEVNRLSKGTYRKFLDELLEHQRFLFREYGFLRLTALIRTDNRASRLLARRMGYSLEGIKRKGFQLGKDNIDLCLYSILREEVLHGRHYQPDERTLHTDGAGSRLSVHGQSVVSADRPVGAAAAAVRGRDADMERSGGGVESQPLREQPAGVLESEESNERTRRGLQSKRNGDVEPVGELRFLRDGRIPGWAWQTGPWLRD